MSEHRGWAGRLLVAGTVVYLASTAPAAQGQGSNLADPVVSAEEARELRAYERYVSLLEKNPRRGTALDRVYGFHVERGTLDPLIKSYEDRVKKEPGDGAGWLILGLLESQRGQDAAAVAALQKAEAARPNDCLPAYYLGQALVLVGQPEQAAAAFERALERKPARNDLLEIFQALGRVYQRTQKNDQALQVWGRLEALFPDDMRVQEQIALALAEENQPAQALPRFERLAKKATDPFRQVQLAMQAADLKVKLGQSEAALHDFETMLGKLRPDSWLHREVRRKIEEVFLRNDDQAGLVTYYEKWTSKEPEDIEALVRLGRTLASMGRAGEAQAWYEKAIKLAPSRRDLRLALISQLNQDQKYGESAAQYALWDQADPNNPDTIRDWGAVVLRDPGRPLAERRQAAGSIWRKLLLARPNDPVVTAQVADLFRQADIVDEALALYKRAIELAPNQPQYHEYLGEYLHQLKRSDEAKAAWSQIALGPNKNAKNLTRLAEVLAGFGYVQDAMAPLREAVALDKDDFSLRLMLAGYANRLERYDEAETELAAAGKLAERDEEKTAVLEARVKNDQAWGRLGLRIEALRKELDADKEATSERWRVLARYLEADGKLAEAAQAAEKSIENEPRSVAAWTLAARVRESAGNLGDSAEALLILAEIDRRNRTEHLMALAKVESRLGRTEAALKVGRDLLAAAPGNPDNYEFFAQLCFQHGRSEEGLDALRRAVRANPNDTRIILTLAETLAGQYQTEEAIEIYWRAFDRTSDLDAKLGVVTKLTELYLQRNQFDRLLTRLEHQELASGAGQPPAPVRATQEHDRDVAICVAQALATSGDLGGARLELERLLAASTRDTHLLQQLSKLAEQEGDIESAARYQKQLCDLAPADEAMTRLGQLYSRSGDFEAAQELWAKLASGKGEGYRVYQAMDVLLSDQKPQPVLEISDALVRKDPRDWEALYRDGVALAALGRSVEAAQRFQALIDLNQGDDEMSAFVKAKARNPRLTVPGASTRAQPMERTLPLEERLGIVNLIRAICKLDLAGVPPGLSWSPSDFGQARMSALGWLLSLAEKGGPEKGDEIARAMRQKAEKTPASIPDLWNWFYVCAMRQDNAALFESARALTRAAPTDTTALWAYLFADGGRGLPVGREYFVSQLNPSSIEEDSNAPPLDNDEIKHFLDCYRALQARRPELTGAQVVLAVDAELKRAGRVDEEARFYRDAVAGATRLPQVAGVLILAARRGDVDGLIQLTERFDRLQTGRALSTYRTPSFEFLGPSLAMCQGMSVRADNKMYADVLRIVDFSLAAVRKKNEHQSPGAAARTLRARYLALGGSGYVPPHMIWVGPRYRRAQIDFPQVNEYLDTTVIEVLRTAFELYKRDDLLSDLIGHFRRVVAAAATAADAIYPRLALSSLLWWNDDKDEAIAELTRVVDVSRAESDLRLDLASLLEKQGAYTEALALVDARQPLDNVALRRREELALRVALAGGNVERARQAAERLFGLRLDNDTQIALAAQMQQLGLHELADAVLGRARHRAGNGAAALMGLMLQYQRQQKRDEAAQIAMQVLRSTSSSRQNAPNASLSSLVSADAADQARSAALTVLARSGQLPRLIERARDELKKTPNSIRVHQALADYYTAARDQEKALLELNTILQLRPDDARLRLKIAEQMIRDGQAAEALGHFKAAFKKDPSLLNSSSLLQLQNTLLSAGKADELLELLEAVDLRPASASVIALLFDTLPTGSPASDRVVSLFRKAWAAFPQAHFYLITRVQREDIWRMPEIYDWAREALIPRDRSAATSSPWLAFSPVSAQGTRTAKISVTLLAEVAARLGKLDELASEIVSTRKKLPAWTASDALLALVLCRAGRYDEAEAAARKLLETVQKDPAAASLANLLYVYSAIAQELERNPASRDAAATMYQHALQAPSSFIQFRLERDQTPAGRLVDLYRRDGRLEDARRALLNLVREFEYPEAAREDLTNLYRMQELDCVARELIALGFVGDAVSLLSEAVNRADTIDPNNPPPAVAAVRAMQSPDQIRQHLSTTIKQINAAALAPLAGRLIAETLEEPTMNKDASLSKQAKPRDQALDMVLLVYPRELDQAAVRSLLAESVAACDARQLAALDRPLELLRQAHPGDLSVAIATALVALAGDDSKRTDSALGRLLELVEATPLEPLPAGTRPNARQRASAARWIPLWVVARACWQRPDRAVQARGDRLAARALDGASRQSDNRWSLAMLREQGQRALDRRDKTAAEATWSQMLKMVVTPVPQPRTQNARPANRPAPASPPAPARAKAPAPSTAPATSSFSPLRRAPSYAASALVALVCCASTSLGEAALPEAAAPFEPRAPYQQAAAPGRPTTDPLAAEEARELRAHERYVSLLEKNPRRGTALDRVYGFHVERGTLDALIKSYEDRVKKEPGDGAGWLILGLLESQRGQDAAAVAALQKAEAARPNDCLPAYYLGQALVLVGQPEQAAAAFERALERKPARNDLLEIFQALGRVYQRTQKNDQALQVWGRLEALFPDDMRVQEQIALALAEENQPAQALPRFERLAKKATDPFRQVQLAMQAADLKVKLGQSEQALHDFETMLGKLRPDSWLHREVRRKIEEVFLRNDDQAGLVTYYEKWTSKEPEDIEALVRLGKTLASMGRAGEAQAWFEKAIKLAPSRRDLRLALISQLNQDQKYGESAAQYALLDQADPNNPDTIRDWGAMVLRDPGRPLAERRQAAGSIWRKLLLARPNDPVVTAQVADLFRQADMVDEALALYKRAIELAPNNPQYHEYLGEYLHHLKRSDEAKAAWSQIALGPNKNAKNLTRLAEVLAGFGYVQDAMAPLREAVALDKDDFSLRLMLAGYANRLERYDEAETELAAAGKLAERDEEKTAVLEARVKNDQAWGRLGLRIEALRKELDADKEATSERWRVLARYLEADGKLAEAAQAAEKSIENEPRSVAAWTLAARVRESAGSLGDSADALRRLAEIDRRNRTEHLTGIARLESRLGRTDQALKAGRELLAAAPGNPDNYEFFAQLCFGLGRSEEGLDALRRAVRANPTDTKITLTLAETLAGQYQTDEAIEMYWRAFDKADDLDAKLGIVSKLTELHLQRNQFDRLLTRIQNQERERRPGASQPHDRDVAICTAQAYATSGDLGSARAELERLLAANTRDTQLLTQLSKLSEEEGDIESAARYQKQLNDLAPSDDNATRLGQLYSRSGELELAQAVWSKLAAGRSEPHRIFQAIDSLLAQKKAQPVMEVTESLLRKDPRDWEALYRQGLALLDLQKPDEAARRFQAILDLPSGDDEKSALMKAWARDPKLRAGGGRSTSAAASQLANIPLEDRIGQVLQIRIASRVETRVTLSSRAMATVWAPQDFGQARMAALGWMLGQATREGPAKTEELIARFRKASEKTPADARALWDWFYLCMMRNDNPGAYTACKTLSRAFPTDPLALWAYLQSLGGRHRPLGQRVIVATRVSGQQKDDTPPLEKAELDHVMECYRGLRARRPELAQAQILQHVDDELKRAGRIDDEEKFYREAIAGATQLGQIAGAFNLSAARGDVDALILLADRLDRLQSARGVMALANGGFSRSFGQAMGVCAQKKAYGDVLRLLDHELASVRKKQERQTPAAARAARARLAGGATGFRIQVWVGNTARVIAINFPRPNEYLDSTAIAVLRTAFEIYKRDDILSDLIGHFRRQIDQAPTPADAVYPRLASSALHWWNDEKDEAIAEFGKVAELSKSESELRLDLAELLEQQGQRADALAMADAVLPLDNVVMKRREELALRLAVITGDLDRARQAAERLFGLRLDTETQVSLAGQMSQLGLSELAEAVLGRARQRAGNKATALVGMMLQYQTQGKLDTAVQVAMQILRSTTAIRQTNPNVIYPDDPDASRTAAIGVLARSGRLTQLIEQADLQLKKTPNSVQIHQTLADYYKASNQRDKARAELNKIVELRPDDLNLRYQIATQLAQEGQAAAAVEHYKAILKKDPSVVGRNIFQVQNAFQQAGKSEELVTLLEEIDLRQFGQSSMVYNVISNMFFDERQKDAAVRLFKKAWKAFPDDRSRLLNFISNDRVWQIPEMYEYALETIVPRAGAFVPQNQWSLLSQIISYNVDGRMNSILSRLLDLSAKEGKLDDLLARIGTVCKEIPEWKAGGVFRALVECRLGRIESAQATIRDFLAQPKDETIPYTVYWLIGSELENHAKAHDLALAAYETSARLAGENQNSRLDFDYGPARRLIALYVRDKRREDARKLLVEVPSLDNGMGYPDGYLEQMRMQSLGSAAAELLKLGFAADAVALYNESIGLAAQIPADAPNYIGNRDGLARQHRDALTQALSALKPEDLTASLARTIAGNEAAAAKKTNDSGPSGATPKKVDTALDLVVMVHPRELDKATLRSLLADTVEAAGRAITPDEQKARDQLAAMLEASRKSHPDDLSLAITESLLALGSGVATRIEPALARLADLVDKSSLEALAPGARANARQRAMAARQVPLWLVARACWTQKGQGDFGPVARKLAARALEAARRQSDPAALMAILREQGELALARGDRAGAEDAWGEMLKRVVEPADRGVKKPEGAPQRKPAAPVPAPRATSMVGPPVRLAAYRAQQSPPSGSTVPGQPRARAAGPRAPRTASPRSNLPLLTLEKFEQAMQIARLAADHDLPDLSVRAVRESLRAGPPIVPAPPTTPTARTVIRSRASAAAEGPVDQVSPRVVANLIELDRLWRKHKMKADQAYPVLREAVLPAARPDEVFLYAAPLAVISLRRPQSVGMLLADWAVQAGKADDLKQAVSARKGSSTAALPAAILSAQLALAMNDPVATDEALKLVAARLKTDTSRNSAELACHVALPALYRPEAGTSTAAMGILESAARGMEATNQPEPLASLLLAVARRQFELGDAAAGRRGLDNYLATMDKSTIRYGGDTPLFLRKQQLHRVAQELVRAGLWSDALEVLGRFVDAPSYSGGDPPVDDVIVPLLRQLAASPARERSETLRAWALPAKDRKVVRILTALAAPDAPPAVFSREGPARGAGASVPVPPGGGPTLFSTATALFEAARQAGTLDKLADEARALADLAGAQKVENAEAFYLLVELARSKGARVIPRIEARLDEVKKDNERGMEPAGNNPAARARVTSAQPRRLTFSATDSLIAISALRDNDPLVGRVGERFTRALIRRGEIVNDWDAQARLRRELARALARRAGAPEAISSSLPASWRPADSRAAAELARTNSEAVWVAHQGVLAHPAGSASDFLVFDYPLTGTFDVSVDLYVGPAAGSAVAWSGLAVLPSYFGSSTNNNTMLFPLGAHENITIPWTLSRPLGFNRVAIHAEPTKVRYLVNGHLLYQDDDPSPTSPWLALLASRGNSAWRNLKIEGEPKIPRDVRLSQGDRLEGWLAGFYRETVPTRRTEQQTDQYGNVTQVALSSGSGSGRSTSSSGRKPRGPVILDDFDWAARDGVIHGRRVFAGATATAATRITVQESSNAAEADQSRLYYFRPLEDGDTISYEFLYEPGQIMVHPALDRLAFLLEEGGVRVHWMTAGGLDASGLAADNVADEPANRRGPRPLPLKSGAWNAVTLALKGTTVTIDLNGTIVYECPLGPTAGRQFGLFHFQDQTAAQARNLVLRGRWPEQLPRSQLDDLLAPDSSAPHSEAIRTARHAVIGEPLFALAADDILDKADRRPPGERFAFLADWVLPGPDHPVCRLEGAFSPSFPPPARLKATASTAAVGGASRFARVQSGGEVRSPAIELVDTAKSLGKLDELAKRIDSIELQTESDSRANERGKLALHALVQLARGDDAGAAKTLVAITALNDPSWIDQPEWARWPELGLIARAIARPGPRVPALSLLGSLISQYENEAAGKTDRTAMSGPWKIQLFHLRARATALTAIEKSAAPAVALAVGADPDDRSWVRVTPATAESRGCGSPVPTWTSRDRQMTHDPGHGFDQLYLATPLRGSFQVDGELTFSPGREIRVGYGGLAVGPKADLKHLELWQFGKPESEVALNPPLAKPGEWYPFRLVSSGGRVSWYLGGRKVHDAPMLADGDPWLTFTCSALESGAFRNVTISGKPTVPEKLSLISLPGLPGWSADEYAERLTGENPQWERRADEIVGRILEENPGSKQESVLRYHRPMAEDGRIAYEFYYEPGKVLVHPSLDRLAFLLDPDGVKIHELTDGAFERNGLTADNARDEPESRRGPASIPLKPNAWNNLVLSVAGDKVALELNGQAIFERPLEPTNQRTFGLFHFADETQARVRNASYQGNWPRHLPESPRPREGQ